MNERTKEEMEKRDRKKEGRKWGSKQLIKQGSREIIKEGWKGRIEGRMRKKGTVKKEGQDEQTNERRKK